MKIKLYILNAHGGLEKLSKSIDNAARTTIEKVKKIVDVPDMNIFVIDNPWSCIPEIGVGGFTYGPNLIQISVNPRHKGIGKTVAKEIRSTVAHEMNHAVRMNKFGYSKTLLEALVSEGLADHFDVEVNGGKAPIWATRIKGKELYKLIARAKKEFSNKNYNHNDWFYGSIKRKIPRWAGYSIGYSLVGDYIKKSGKSASEITLNRF